MKSLIVTVCACATLTPGDDSVLRGERAASTEYPN
jgi:hypothetical protein